MYLEYPLEETYIEKYDGIPCVDVYIRKVGVNNYSSTYVKNGIQIGYEESIPYYDVERVFIGGLDVTKNFELKKRTPLDEIGCMKLIKGFSVNVPS